MRDGEDDLVSQGSREADMAENEHHQDRHLVWPVSSTARAPTPMTCFHSEPLPLLARETRTNFPVRMLINGRISRDLTAYLCLVL